MGRFGECLGDLQDPRRGNARRHELLELIVIALSAMLCGAESCVDTALFGEAKQPLLRQFLKLPGGVPSHDTFSRLFRLLDPEAFQTCFMRFMAAFIERTHGVAAVDGKSVRRSFDRAAGASPLDLISAWGCEQRLVLGQMKVADGSNEIDALPDLLAMLDLDGCTVTADAMHCQRETARQIDARGGVYPLNVKN